LAITLSEIRVEFHGEGAGVGELTWGQMGIRRASLRNNRTINLAFPMPPPEGACLADVAGMLRFMVSRYPALRTRLRFTDEPSGDRHPQQVIAAAGEVPLHIVDIGGDDDPAAAAEELRWRYQHTWFDYENEFPVRMGVIRQSGELVRLVVCYSHVMVDGSGLDILHQELKHLDRITGEATGPAGGRSPLELAGWQGSAAGRRQSERAIKYWASQLGRLPAWRLEEPGRQDAPRFAELMVYSPAMQIGMRAIAARTRADATSVLLAAYSAAVARVFGRDPSLALLSASNRFRPGLADMVSQVAQHGICVVDVGDATFDEVVARAQKATTAASFYAYYDPVACDMLLDETAARLGQPLDAYWWINDMRTVGSVDGGSAGGDGGMPTEAEVAEVLPRTRLYWNPETPDSHGTLFFFVDSRPERIGGQDPGEGLPAIYMKVWADTQHFALDQIEALIREMEAVVVAATFDAGAVASRE
jgi:Condensation domain